MRRCLRSSLAGLAAGLLLGVATVALGGCGQKGPLLLPEPATSGPNTGSPADDDDDDDDGEETSGTGPASDSPSSPTDGG